MLFFLSRCIIIPAFFFLLIFFSSCKTENKEKKEIYDIPVKLLNIEKTKITDYLTLKGEIDGIEEAVLYPPYEGHVKNILKSEGDFIRKTLSILSINRDYTGLEYKELSVDAPINGYISEIYVSDGDFVKTDTKLCKIIKIDKVKFTSYVTTKELKSIQLNQKCEIKTNVYNEMFIGNVTSINPAMEEKTRTISIEAEIDNRDKKLKPGMYATAKIIKELDRSAVFVPILSVVFEDERRYVYKYNRATSTVTLTEVKTGDVSDKRIEIIDGLKIGDKIVVDGVFLLRDGIKVEPVN